MLTSEDRSFLTLIQNQRGLDLKTTSTLFQLFELGQITQSLLFMVLIWPRSVLARIELDEMCPNTQEMLEKREPLFNDLELQRNVWRNAIK